jgi:hypothetical protein
VQEVCEGAYSVILRLLAFILKMVALFAVIIQNVKPPPKAEEPKCFTYEKDLPKMDRPLEVNLIRYGLCRT